MKKRKINTFFLFIGFLAIIAAILTINYTYNSLYILKNGDIEACPVIHIDYSARGGNHAVILLHGQKFSAGQVESTIHLNDTIEVKYIKGKTRVVVAKNNYKSYYFFFVLESILLIIGGIIVVGGFWGKSMYDSYSPKHIKTKSNKRK